jgi:hypothetical protein
MTGLLPSRGTTMEKYYHLLAVTLAASVLAIGCVSASASVPVYKIDGQNLRGAPILKVDETQQQKDIAFIANWVLHNEKNGHPLTFHGNLPKAGGLGEQDVNGFGVSFYDKSSDAIKYFFFVFASRSEKLIVRKDVKFNIYWFIDGDNHLRTTVYMDNTGLSSVPNDKYRITYDDLIAMFLGKAKEDTSGAERSGQAPRN